MNGLASTGRGAEGAAPSSLPSIAIGGRTRLAIVRAANDNGVAWWRHLAAPVALVAGLLLLLVAL